MKNIFLFTLVFLSFFISSSEAKAQFGVEGVSYKMKYNNDSCWYDIFLVINAGSATTQLKRVQFNSQISFVVPTGSTFTVTRGYMPMINNQAGTATPGTPYTTPTAPYYPSNFWYKSSVVTNPASAAGKDFISLVPTIPGQGTAYYNILNQGDEVKLFSVKISPEINCTSDMRLYINGVDPNSAAAGMQGNDFSNAFTIENAANQVYNDNKPQIYPTNPVINPNPIINTSNGIEIDITASTTSLCNNNFSYLWTGPNGYTSTSEDVSIIPSVPANNGTYSVICTDNIGCKDSLSTNAFNVGGGPDQVTCAGTNISLQGTPNNGIWLGFISNPPGAVISAGQNGQATVLFSNSAGGIYRFVYSASNSSDTVAVLVNPLPSLQLEDNEICVGTTTTLVSNQIGTWVSNNPSIATVSGNVVTGNASGLVTFTFTNSSTGCSKITQTLVVSPKPVVSVSLPDLCVGIQGTLAPVSGGTWTSSNPDVLLIVQGVMTAKAPGTTLVIFKQFGSECESNPILITVNAKPTIVIAGSSSICKGNLTILTASPATSGTWSSSNPNIAIVNNQGLVTGISPGFATFTFTSAVTACSSNPSSPITVLQDPLLQKIEPDVLCNGKTLQLTAPSVGSWISSNNSVATISPSGLITAVGNGSVLFTFTDINGCSSKTNTLTVDPCNQGLIEGYIFNDINGNDVFEPNIDYPLPSARVEIPQLNKSVFTNDLGYYALKSDTGSYEAIISVPFGSWVTNPISKNIKVGKFQNYLIVGLQAVNSSATSASCGVNATPYLCEEISIVNPFVFNNGSKILNGLFVVEFDNKTELSKVKPIPNGADGKKLTWAVSSLSPGFSFSPQADVVIPKLAGDNDTLIIRTSFVENGSTIAEFVFADTITCAATNNIIKSFPDREGERNYTLRTEPIQYSIKFENTSGQTIRDVVVENTISKYLEPTSLIIKESSHKVRAILEDDKVTFYFDSINLRNSSELTSAFINFELKQKPNLAIGTQIFQQAKIMMNENTFTTNLTLNTITDQLPCSNVNEAIKVDGGTLTALGNGSNYVWYNCETNAVVQSSTSPIFKPLSNGSYYVVIENNNCKNISACTSIITDVNDILQSEVKVYPNPVIDELIIETELEVKSIKVINEVGKVMGIFGNSKKVDMGKFTPGFYIIEVGTEKGVVYRSVVRM